MTFIGIIKHLKWREHRQGIVVLLIEGVGPRTETKHARAGEVQDGHGPSREQVQGLRLGPRWAASCSSS